MARRFNIRQLWLVACAAAVALAVALPATAQSTGIVKGVVLGAAGPSKEAVAKNAELKKAFEEGVAASRAGNHDEAIAKFQAAAALNSNCFDCHYNIAFSYAQKKEY